ncbi:putative btb poz domain protein [Neofusicoccum parvum]|nr:putative btb poz domain protein [Neofusicoccum parvum]
MSTRDPSEPLKNGISEYYSTGLFSDLEIRASNGDRHHVHKLVVSAQCKFLADALNPLYGFKESQTNIVELKHEPRLVKALLEYLYRFDYQTPADEPTATAAATTTNTSSGGHKPGATSDAGGGEGDAAAAQPATLDPSLLFHARLHAAARFYGVPGLASLALARFVAVVAPLWRRPAVFAQLVRVLYAGDADGDGGEGNKELRAAVVEVAAQRFGELGESVEWRGMMDGEGVFGRELCAKVVEREAARRVAAGYSNGFYISER